MCSFIQITKPNKIETEFEMDMEIHDDGFDNPQTIQARFVSDTGEEAGPPLELPTSVNVSQLGRICNEILEKVCSNC